MAVCERPPFWRWFTQITIRIVRSLPRELVWLVRMVLGRMVSAIRPSRVMSTIREPFYEFFIGIMALFFVPMIVLLDSVASDPYLTSTMKIIVTFLIIPSFLLMMHGTYRAWWDC